MRHQRQHPARARRCDEKVYSYNRANRLIAANVTINGVSENKTFEYDNAGIRVSSRDNSNNLTEYLIDRNRDYAQVIIEDTPSGITAYSYGDDLLSQNRAGAVSYYHYDGLGSTRALSDNSGALTDSYDYEAFGALLNQSGATSNDYLYTGEQYDTELSQYYLRAHYYNPTIGRFTQMDTWMGRNHDPVTLHKYLYANTDPVGYVDPSGNTTLPSLSSALNIASSLAGYSTTILNVVSRVESAVSLFQAVHGLYAAWGMIESNGLVSQIAKDNEFSEQLSNLDRAFAVLTRNMGRILKDLSTHARVKSKILGFIGKEGSDLLIYGPTPQPNTPWLRPGARVRLGSLRIGKQRRNIMLEMGRGSKQGGRITGLGHSLVSQAGSQGVQWFRMDWHGLEGHGDGTSDWTDSPYHFHTTTVK
ncbi:MAG: hypothetical protein Tsb002_19780 [Wenzhouxiangellaceae bacterium]